MDAEVKTRTVTLDVRGDATFNDSQLPKGLYTGTEVQLGIPMAGEEVRWTNPEYKLGLTADQMRDAGIPVEENLVSMTEDVSKFVTSGAIIVRP
ncbi:hypothetical protein MTX26_35575 (plasmid) [Bradyrhizobium sp. ISRA443]|uniref:hypothetical protein n=1 Tax=unclassified Bradyrhizobium TaxID=2631580 RepID=UPI0024785089|nr:MULTISPECIES: hypothetical protein [unclassified Bradyrhizobium]WGR90745.1 hypothetical protein MTX20_01445 [Bradyrhizobium sp. ISRA435]WGS03123.1 hypothetical protein MTX23_35045 [Bradyrhizobium sp. ISRA436]WGS10083.1 hypothetical protein MTX18_35575 [Bradyrhizobium sp. ISRA437]WGS16968.1 hypothetical protein MTX26_35575 [Bradyrhizobium sp. ISRA443]